MDINLLENNNSNNLGIENNNKLEIGNEQKNFLETKLGQTINTGIDLGLKALLPDLIEDKIINIKDVLITEGFKPAINQAIESAVNFGKSFIGIFTGNFENAEQVNDAVKKGGLVDSVSNVLDNIIEKAEKNKLISPKTSEIIKTGKDTIVESVNKNIENTLENQIKLANKLNKNIDSWTDYYNQKDFNNMEKKYNQINKQLKEIIPLENIIIKARQLENIHNLIKNNGKNFNLSEEELSLANKLI